MRESDVEVMDERRLSALSGKCSAGKLIRRTTAGSGRPAVRCDECVSVVVDLAVMCIPACNETSEVGSDEQSGVMMGGVSWQEEIHDDEESPSYLVSVLPDVLCCQIQAGRRFVLGEAHPDSAAVAPWSTM